MIKEKNLKAFTEINIVETKAKLLFSKSASLSFEEGTKREIKTYNLNG